MPRVVVVGGGISGLTAAYRLRQLLGDSASITVVEASAQLGGKLRTVSLAGMPFDVGAEAFLMRRPEAAALVAEVGLGDDLLHPTKARALIRAGGQLATLPSRTVLGIPTAPDALTEILTAEGNAKVAAEIGLPPVVLPEVDVDLGELLRERFGAELVEKLVDLLLGGVYAGGADGLGLRATMPGLARALTRGNRTLTEAAASLVPASPLTTPVFGTLRGGLVGLVNRLADLSRAEIRLGVPVRQLRAQPGGGWQLELGAVASAHQPSEATLDADVVVLAVPAPAARRLLDGVSSAAAAAMNEVELASMAVVGLALPPGTTLPSASGVLVGVEHEPERRLAVKAMTFSARKWPHYGDSAGPVLLRGSIGRFGEAEALQVTDDELVRRMRADLAELTGITVDPLETVVVRWGGGLPQYAVGHLERIARIENAVAQIPNLEIIGATLHGVGIPACIATADAAAHRVAAAWQSRVSRGD